MREKRNSEHNEKVRKRMKQLYYENDGKTKKLLAYYKKKFKNDDYAVAIFNDTEFDLKEKLRIIHEYNNQLKIEKMLDI